MLDALGSGPLLCGVDDTDEATEVLRAAARLAADAGRPLVVMTAHTGPPAPAAGTLPPRHAEVLFAGDPTRTRSAERLSHIVTSAEVMPAETLVRTGDPATAILEAADDVAAAVIVVGSRGRGTVAGAVLGSVSADLLAESHLPVVIVPVGATVGTGPVIAAVDGSRSAAAAARVAGSVRREADAPLLLANVVPSAPRAAGPRDVLMVRDEERRRRGATVLADAAGGGAPPDAEFRVLAGTTADALAGLADREDARLLVLGGRTRGPVRRVFEGDSALALAGVAPCPVMVVPPTAEPPPR